MEISKEITMSVLVAALGGAAVGMERQHSGHAERFGGLRTFSLLGMVAGVAGVLWGEFMGVSLVLAGGAAALILVSYWTTVKEEVDATTEMAGMVVLGSGFLAGQGAWGMASAMVALTTVLLAEKSQLHAWVLRVPDEGLRAGFRFGLMALVVLPLLPEGPIGGVRPRELWVLVLLLSGLSYLGYVARLLAGPGRGYVLTGVLGGVISSTNVTLTLARQSRGEAGQAMALAVAVIGACTMMYVRVGLVVMVLDARLGQVFLRYWLAPALAGVAVGLAGYWLRREGEQGEVRMARNPLAFRAAMEMAVLFQAVMFGLEAVKGWFGEGSLYWSGAVLGFAEVDAMTIAIGKSALAEGELGRHAMAIGIGCLSNSVFKLGIAMVVGQGDFRWKAGMMFAVQMGAAVASLMLGWW
ncbi:MAG: DUF4010 domain-containing protein [Bryobacter sp.]|nr:DUF4010 domain-containing protein [Bryobacter sp. CoA8 C33]